MARSTYAPPAELFQEYDSRSRGSDLRQLANMLDNHFRLPGGFRVGWDGILGLVPVFGDLATNALSFYVLARAALLGCPPVVLARMALNILIDNALDAVPVLGNFFDFFWKSNSRNLRLMDAYLQDPRRTVSRSRFAVATALLTVLVFALAMLAASVYVAVSVIGWIAGRFGAGWGW